MPLSYLLVKGVPFVAGHVDKDLTIICFPDFVHRADIGMIEGRCGLCFVDETLCGGFVTGEFGSEKFESDKTIQF